MVRLVELEHHVVADVDHVVDRALPHGGKPGSHPRRAGADVDAGQHGQREAPAALAGDDLDGGVGGAAERRESRPLCRERQPQLGRQISADADVPEGVGTVARDVDVEHHVVDESGDLTVGDPE